MYIVTPRALSLFAEQVFQYDKAMFSAGLRYERFSSNADRPYALDTVASSATFNTYQPFPRISSYAGTFNGDSLVTSVRDQSHGAFSPRFRLTFAASPRTEFRAGFSRQTEIPDFSLLFAGLNTDLAITSLQQPFGSDLDLLHSWIAEVGGRRRLGHGTSIDLAAFTRSGSTIVAQLVRHPDPTRHDSGLDIWQYVSADAPRVDGGEIRVERQAGWLTGSLGYAYQHASQSGGTVTDRPHTVSAAVGLRTHTGGRLRGIPLCERAALQPVRGAGQRVGAERSTFCGSGQLLGLNSARLRPAGRLDLRVTQAVRLGGKSLTALWMRGTC